MNSTNQTFETHQQTTSSPFTTGTQIVIKEWTDFITSAKEFWQYYKEYEFKREIFWDRETWRNLLKVIGKALWVLMVGLVYILSSLFVISFSWLKNYFTYIREVFFGPVAVYNNWYHLFDEMEYSAITFFDEVENEIQRHEIPDKYKVKRVKLWESNIFSPRRWYLKIRKKNFVVFVGAAKYGKGYFFSWYQAEQQGFFATLLYRILGLIPYFGAKIVEQYKKKTFYRWDTANMFRERIHQSILSVIDELTTVKGLKGLTIDERQPIGFK